MNIEQAEKIASEMKSFRDCYEGEELWGGRDTFVPADKLVEFILERPDLISIAQSIGKLTNPPR